MKLRQFIEELGNVKNNKDIHSLIEEIGVAHVKFALLAHMRYWNVWNATWQYRKYELVKVVQKDFVYYLDTEYKSSITSYVVDTFNRTDKFINMRIGDLRFKLDYDDGDPYQIMHDLQCLLHILDKAIIKEQNKMKPVPTLTDVQRVTEELLVRDGKTTTLWVKNKLRKEKFWATQEAVGGLMEQLHTEQTIPGLAYDFNGRFRTYTVETVIIPVPVMPVADDDDGNDDDEAVVQRHDYECWAVYETTDIGTYTAVTRGCAKWQHAKEHDCDYFDVRSRKVT